VAAVRERGEIAFRWVKGHSGDPMNDLVDRLAVEAAASQAGLAE
jgi:ribonuclease HI